jgi:hypothetical protein
MESRGDHHLAIAQQMSRYVAQVEIVVEIISI